MEIDYKNQYNKDKLIIEEEGNTQFKIEKSDNREDTSSTLNPSFQTTGSTITDNEYEVTSESNIDFDKKKKKILVSDT